MMPVASCIPLPFFAPCDDTLAMLVCSTHWLSIHSRTPPFVCLLACLLAFLFLCLPCLSCLVTLCLFYMLFASFSFHYLFAGFLSLPLHVHIWSEDAWSQGTVSQAQAKRARMQACRYKPSSYVWQILGSSFSHLVMHSFKPPSFHPSFSLRWVVLGISGHVSFVLIFRVWRSLFTFLHLYFRPCSRDVGIYFHVLCVCIVHDVCIYIPAHPSRCDCHSLCHLR